MSTGRLLLRGGRLVDPVAGRDEIMDVLITDGEIAGVGDVGEVSDRVEVLELAGMVVAPGLVDMHTHLREPGREDEETIESASCAAVAGGFTAVCAMPNTDPVADTASVVEKVWARGREVGLCEVVPAGAISRGLAGEKMADLGEMARSMASVRLFTDDRHGVQNALLARRVMEYLTAFDAIYAEHCEDASLALGGQMNEGERSAALGLRGIPAAAEELMAARDISLAQMTGCRLHLLHVSTAGTVEMVRRAKADGVRVTCEATPHHFSLTDDILETYDPNAKVNPPLREEIDRLAIIEGVKDGTINAIATDHAPHAPEEKDREFIYAPPGMVGLETALALTISELVETGHLSLPVALERLSSAPARILGLREQGCAIEAGATANLVVFDPTAEWTVDPRAFNSKSINTPFAGRSLKGKVVHTFFKGRQVVRDGQVLREALV